MPRACDAQFIASVIVEIDAASQGCMRGIDLLAGGRFEVGT